MNGVAATSTEPSDINREGGLPVDLRALAIGLWRRRAIPVLFLVVSLPLAALASMALGERTYVAETVLLYKPVQLGGEVASDAQTQMHMVKVQGNLEEVGARLRPQRSARDVAAATDVRIQKNTDLLFIRATATGADQAAQLANALRDVFLESQQRVRRAEAERRLQDMGRRLEEVKRALADADRSFADFTTQNRLVDLDKETASYLQEQMSLAVLYQQAVGDRMSVEQQAANLQQTIRSLRKKVADEQAAAGGNEDLTSLNIRIGRLRSSIEEDRRFRAATAIFTQKEVELQRMKQLHDKGLVSALQLQRAQAEYDEQKALAEDTEQIKQWKGELERLDQGVIPKGASDTPTSGILRDVMLRALDIELQRTSIGEKVKQLEAAQAQVKEKLQALPRLQSNYIEVRREIESREAELRTLQDTMVRLRSAYESGAADFTLVAAATPPAYASDSTRKPLFAAIAVAALFLGLVLMATGELTDRTVRSAAEVPLRVGRPLLGVIPRLPTLNPSHGLLRTPETLEPFRRLALQVRRAMPRKGARILLVGTAAGEGTTVTAAHLAACLARQGEDVLVVEANLRKAQPATSNAANAAEDPLMAGGVLLPGQVERAVLSNGAKTVRSLARVLPGPALRVGRWTAHCVEGWLDTGRRGVRWLMAVVRGEGAAQAAPTPSFDLATLLDEPVPARAGLETYLVAETTAFESVTVKTGIPGVSLLRRSGLDVPPDLVGTNRMRQLLFEASSRYSVILVDGPAGLASADAEALAPWMDAVVLIVRSQHVEARWIRSVAERLAATGTLLPGAVLTGADPRYLRRDEVPA